MFKYTGVSMQVAARAPEISASDTGDNLWTHTIKIPLGLGATQFGVINNPRVAGGLASTHVDIIRWGRFILNDGKNTAGNQIIDNAWMQEL